MDFVVSGYDSVKFRKTYHKNNTGQRLIGHTDASFHENVCNVLFRQSAGTIRRACRKRTYRYHLARRTGNSVMRRTVRP